MLSLAEERDWVMKKIAISILAAGVVLSWGTGAWAAESKNFEQKADELNATAKSGEKFNAAIHAISVETGVPEDRLMEMHRQHPQAGPAAILNASILADETRQPPEKFLKNHQEGIRWEDIAHKNKVPIEKLDSRLNRVQRYVATGKMPERAPRKNRE
jgi:hypothetical protein